MEENGIYFIENVLDEIHTGISGVFKTLDDAKEGLKDCADWFRPNGTGKIFFREFGVHGKITKVFESI